MKMVFVLVLLFASLAAQTLAAEDDFKKSPVKQFTKTELQAPAENPAPEHKAENLDTAYYKAKNYQASFLGETVRLLLSADGLLQANDDLNVIIITDHKDNLETINKMLEDVDTLPEQIVIEAKVLEVRNDFSKDSGINIASAFEHTTIQAGQDRSQQDTLQEQVSESANGSQSSMNFVSALQHRGDHTVDVRYSNMSDLINYIVENDYGRVVAEPRIVTVNNKTGRVFIGNRIKFSNSLFSYGPGEYKVAGAAIDEEAGIILEVTPHIGNGDFITMNIRTGFGELTSMTGYSSNVYVREANSTVIVKSGEPFVIGGYTTQEENVTKYKFPVLGDVPLLKNFFSKKERSTVDVQLVMVLTPHIVKPGTGAEEKAIEQEYTDQ